MRHGILCFLLLTGCADAARRDEVPLFANLGRHHRAVSTSSERAQRYFDQGLVLAYGFNRAESARSFQQAAALDPGCAMAWWGIAYASGPDINFPMGPEQARSAFHAVQRAAAAAARATPVEQALVRAMAARYAWPNPEDRRPLDLAYAEAMEQAWLQFPDDPDVAALYAEALMDLRPWDLWTGDGQPQPGTERILQVLEQALQAHPAHPALLHFYVHAVEASPHPEKALAAAGRLSGAVPGAGHLEHMPSHIYVRVGRYQDAIDSNRRAVAADAAYLKRSPGSGPYHYYRAHSYHLLSFAAMMQGSSAVALAAARDSVAAIPPSALEEILPFVDGYLTFPMHVLLRFGRWEDVLREPAPDPKLRVATALWHYARGAALANLDRVAEAQAEQEALAAAVGALAEGDFVGLNPARAVLEVAGRMLAGEIAARAGGTEAAVGELRAAAAAEDALRYNEPPDWMTPARHALGAVLLNAGRIAEAEAEYREDLARNPGNGWSLFGLARCLRARGAEAEAEATERLFQRVWSHADVELTSSCFCQAGR
ncbi:MAG: hypothetical protein EYC70_01575 [Planctomycetota bacterium]|nr:MAG: hypothetical protein EYC70_01575 [Planctomycetota bacterium]